LILNRKKVRSEFNSDFIDGSIMPDGGMLYLKNQENNEKLPLVIADINGEGKT
jgi:hypothetical protein